MDESPKTNTEVQQVMVLVQTLTHALQEERLERRRQARQRRWAGGLLAFFLLVAGWMLGNQGGQLAYATTNASTANPIKEMESMGNLLQVMNKMVTLIAPQMAAPSPFGQQSNLQQALEDMMYLVHNLRQMSELFGGAFATPTDQANVQQMLRDLPILSKRIKQDSDVLRAFILEQQKRDGQALLPNPYASFTPNLDQLSAAQLDHVRASATMLMPAMQESLRGELNFLNRSIAHMDWSMGVMAGSMGSTMGRIGSWMP
ncbi:MAG: hypothetical protein HQM04_09345 [Magnetococcales bacterium]|nr:hypothetical protein [Magnetococcales bacterium]MBF0115237.1 hypothetical protein [Magnetococcales bacterium]